MAKENKKQDKYLKLLEEKALSYKVELKHSYIGTEHLLLALLSEENSIIPEYFKQQKITLDNFKSKLINIIGESNIGQSGPHLKTPLFESVLEETRQFASDNSLEINSVLVMIHIIWMDDGIALRILDAMSFNDTKLDDMEDFLSAQIGLLDPKVMASTSGMVDDNTFNCLTDMHKQVKENETVVTGFDDELEQLVKSLLRYKKPNVIILGEPGVGKTALVEKLAIAINNKDVPPIIQNYRILQLSINSALAGTRYRGDFEEKIEKVLTAVSKQKNIILFIDEIHNIVGAGAAGNTDSTLDAANIFKPYLARGAIKVIGATTNKEYEHIKGDGALARRFKTIEVLEPDTEQTMRILKSMKSVMFKNYNVKLTDKQLKDIYYKSTFRKGRMPDAALDEMEEFCVDIYYNKSKESMKEKVNA